MADDGQVWTIVDAGMNGVMILPIFIVWIVTLGVARRRSDPARTAFSWLKAPHMFLVASLGCVVASDITVVYQISWQNSNGSYDTVDHSSTAVNALRSVSTYASLTSSVLEKIADAIFVVLLVELGNGVRHVQARHIPTFRKPLRFAAFGIAVVLLALALASFGLLVSAWVSFYNGDIGYLSENGFDEKLKTGRQLNAAYFVLGWVVSIAQIVYASFVLPQTAGMTYRGSAVIYLVVTVLDFIRWLSYLILYAAWVLPVKEVPQCWAVVGALLDTWVRFVILVLLLVIGARKVKGIWLTQRTWNVGLNMGPPPQMMMPPPPQQYDMQKDYNQHQFVPYQQPYHQQQQDLEYQNPEEHMMPHPTPQLDSRHRYEVATGQEVLRPQELSSHYSQPTFVSSPSPQSPEPQVQHEGKN